MRLSSVIPSLVLSVVASAGCDTPSTSVIVQNQFAPVTSFVVYRAFWQAVAFDDPIAPGEASDPASTVPASPNTAWALVAPGWDPASAATPTSFIVLQSRGGFAVSLRDTLRIPVDDTTFAGDCAAGSTLSQQEADFITRRVFAAELAGLVYDAATCTTTPASGP